MKKNVLAIIPARQGSRRLPNKNNKKIGKNSLVDLSIKAALKSKMIDEIAVTSNDKKVFRTVNKFSNIKLIKRPNKLSNSKAKLSDVCDHVIRKFKKKFSYFILLQPTSPLRTHKHIDKAIKKTLKLKAAGLISISSTNNNEKNYYYVKNKYLYKSYHNKDSKLKKFQFNGAIYIIKTNLLKKSRSFFIEGKILPFMMPKKQSIDIDYKRDLMKAKSLNK